ASGCGRRRRPSAISRPPSSCPAAPSRGPRPHPRRREMSETRDAVREICDTIIKHVDRAYVADCGKKNILPEKLWRMWIDTGLLSMGLPEEYGGAGGSLGDLVYALDL